MPRRTTPLKPAGLEIMTSLSRKGEEPVTPGMVAARSATAMASRMGFSSGVWMTMCALVPRIFSLRSFLKPPITLITTIIAMTPSATPVIEIMVMMETTLPRFLAIK